MYRLLILIILLSVSTYTASYGVWTLKQKNKIGAIGLFVLAGIVFILPIYITFFR